MYNLFLKKFSVFLLFFASAIVALAMGSEDKFILVIDAGHGGKDTGAIGRNSKEKNINLKVALAFGQMVEEHCPDVKVVYTRKTDIFVPLQERADLANNVKADLFISIHTNSLPKGRIAYGTETYTLGIARADENLEVAKRENSVILFENNYQQVYQGFDPSSVESYIIFELMQDKNMEQSVEMARCLQQEYVNCGGRKNKGVHQAGFLVLRNTSMPAILTELGFISTPAEERFLTSSEGVRKLSRSLFNGFNNYRLQYDHRCGTTNVAVKADRKVANAQTRPEQPINDQVQQPAAHSAEPVDRPVFKVQILVSDRPLKGNDRRLKGVKPVESYKEKGMYKYTYGNTTDYNDIKRKQRAMAAKFKGAFVVAFLNGERIELSKAIQLSKRK